MIDIYRIILVDADHSFDVSDIPEIDAVISDISKELLFDPIHPLRIHNKAIYISAKSRAYIRRCLIAIQYDISHHQRILTREDTEMFLNDPIESQSIPS